MHHSSEEDVTFDLFGVEIMQFQNENSNFSQGEQNALVCVLAKHFS